MRSPPEWQPMIVGAYSEPDVVAVMQEYLSTMLPSDLAMLPDECQGIAPKSGDEVVESALVLVRHAAKTLTGEPQFELVNNMAIVFASAHDRIRHIRARKQSAPA